MSEISNKEMYKQMDEERIKKAFKNGNFNDAFVLFKYSVLTKDEFSKLQQLSTKYGAFNEQMKVYLKEEEMEKIEEAFRNHKDKEAEVLFEFSKHLSEKDFYKMKLKCSAPKNDKMEFTQEQVGDVWGNVLEQIKNEISSPSFDTWFKQTNGELVDGVLVINCANSFQLDWLEARYSDLISKVTEKIVGTKYDLRFVEIKS